MASDQNVSNQGVAGNTGADAAVNLTEFQALLDRLEGSKKRQVRQKSVEDRRGTFAQGLAGMMSNF
jgi:hypothetical protein